MFPKVKHLGTVTHCYDLEWVLSSLQFCGGGSDSEASSLPMSHAAETTNQRRETDHCGNSRCVCGPLHDLKFEI